MTPKTSCRIAAACFAFICLAHTMGGMLFPVARGEEESNVLGLLASYRFEIMGFTRSHADFYRGEGFYLSLSMALFAALAWQLGTLADEQPATARRLLPIATAFAFGSTALCALYFFAAPLVFSAVATIALLGASARLPGA